MIGNEGAALDRFTDDNTPHKKRAKKKSQKKSDHKHDYELVEIEEWAIKNWFTHKEVCKICSKVNNQLRIMKGEGKDGESE
jgi:hypothetical protein